MPTSSTTSVSYFHSSMTGAPQLNASAGSLVTVLDAVLVNGWALQAITSFTVVAGVATANVANNTNFNSKYTVILIEGSDIAGLNGRKRVTSSTSLTFTFEVTGVSDGSYNGGTPTAKIAPLGWEINRTATNKRMYKSLNIFSNGIKLRVDDTNTATYWNALASVAGTYRSMAKVNIAYNDTSIDSFQGNTECWWIKSYVSTGGPNLQWTIVGDDRGFYINYLPSNQYATGRCDYFGELTGLYRANDQFATVITGYSQSGGVNNQMGTWSGNGAQVASSPQATYETSNHGHSLFNFSPPVVENGYQSGMQMEVKQLARSHTQIGNAKVDFTIQGHSSMIYYISTAGPPYLGNGTGYSGAYAYPYPNGPDQGLMLNENLVVREEGSAAGARGVLPGFVQILHHHPLRAWRQILDTLPNAPGRAFVSVMGHAYPYYYGNVKVAYNATEGYDQWTGEALIDLLGPWRTW